MSLKVVVVVVVAATGNVDEAADVIDDKVRF
jgi:hypothetical protein